MKITIGQIFETLMGILALCVLVYIFKHAANEFGLVYNPADHTSICKP